MKFADYTKKRDELEAQETLARAKALEPIGEIRRKLDGKLTRLWSLGPMKVDAHPSKEKNPRAIYVEYNPGFLGLDIRIDEGPQGRVGLQGSTAYAYLRPEQWRQFAEIVETIDRWKAGTLDDLPPSGVWNVQRGAVR